jgi:thiol-disulfide isomerase/thioredoxin
VSEEPSERSTVSGRRTLGPAPKPGSRYSIIVGLLFLALVVVAFVNLVTTRHGGVLGLEKETTDLPLPEFAIPEASGRLSGDANVFQDDCSTSQKPCPADQRRTPACRIRTQGAIRVCDYFDRPLVISFWFSKGGDCAAQQDVVNRVYQRYRGRVSFLSLDVRDDRDALREQVRQHGWKQPVGYDRDGAVASLYKVGGCPTFAYAYPGGTLQSASIGDLTGAELIERVERLLRATRSAERG